MCNVDAQCTPSRRGYQLKWQRKVYVQYFMSWLKILLFHLYFNGNYERYRILNKIIRVEANK